MAGTVTLTIPDAFTTIDLLCWRYFRREYPGIVDQVFALNQGLADLGAFPQVGTKVVVPLPTAQTTTPAKVITLWTNGP